MPASILIAGATGKTGLILTRLLLDQGHAVTALVREGSDTGTLPQGTALRRADLTDLQPGVCDGADVVIFAAGSGGATGPDMTDKVDRDGATRLVDLAQEAGVTRFVMLSSYGADQADPAGDLAHYLKAKHAADLHLQQSTLTHAILRPVALTDDAGGGDVQLGDAVDPRGTAARADVARLLAQAATDGTYDGQTLNMQSA